MAVWIQTQLTQPEPGGVGVNRSDNQCVPATERDWVLALAALVLNQRERCEMGHD
jgi:hypothetical protein